MDHEIELKTLAGTYRNVRTRAERLRGQLADAIRAAAADGMRQVDIVKATGYTREQVRLIVAGRTR